MVVHIVAIEWIGIDDNLALDLLWRWRRELWLLWLLLLDWL